MRSAVYPERSRRGFTLIELLVVISIISIMAVVGVVSFKDFSEKQVAIKAAGQIQSLLRLAQSNATTSTMCGDKGSTSWSLVFTSKSKVELYCDPGNGNIFQREYNLENVEVEIKCGNIFPTTFTYSTGSGALTTKDCSGTVTFTIINALNTSLFKTLLLSKGGTIDVQ